MRTYVRYFFIPLSSMRSFFAFVVMLVAPITLWAQGRGFNLIVVGDPQPQTEAQIISLERDIIPEIGTIVEEYKATSYPTAILLTGDVVWDTVEFLPRIKQMFETLGVPVYAVMGNHDHNRTIHNDEPRAEREYIEAFGQKYYTFTLGDTRFIALDNILFNSYSDYSTGLDRKQRKWAKNELRNIADNQRIAICMHAPASNLRSGTPLPYVKPLMRLARGHKLHFITGHCHRHNTVDITPDVIEHSVAQVNGNLWFAPMCADGTPRGIFCIEERDGEWTWQHRLLGERATKQLIAWHEGEVKGHEEWVVVKVIGWDKEWRVEWSENGNNMGDMEQITIVDPGYLHYVEHEADYDDVIMERLRRSGRPNSHYFRCRRTKANSHITITATDRFGRRFEVEM